MVDFFLIWTTYLYKDGSIYTHPVPETYVKWKMITSCNSWVNLINSRTYKKIKKQSSATYSD